MYKHYKIDSESVQPPPPPISLRFDTTPRKIVPDAFEINRQVLTRHLYDSPHGY